jgi:hypothetical protein
VGYVVIPADSKNRMDVAVVLKRMAIRFMVSVLSQNVVKTRDMPIVANVKICLNHAVNLMTVKFAGMMLV